ncbi:glycosyltransferase family 4 protein [Chitinophaga rhizosphaerae]|uniref:glycosyltransferase family 4 protein n=1 Tax=Chitinophaga rhizosphaerae TaxID=1864947 RepID=UPI000F7FB890|nr:glycosyltransferase [Chitinophaga rhizosphaerae]
MKKLTILLGTYPDLFFRTGGLQNQILKTRQELEALGHKALLYYEYLSAPQPIDIYHHFSVEPDSLSIFKAGKKLARKTILSPVFNHSNSNLRMSIIQTANRLSPVSLLGYKERQQIWNGADGAVYLANREKRLVTGYLGPQTLPEKIIPNGLPEAFTAEVVSTPRPAGAPYLLHVGGIYPLKNQHISIAIARQLGIPLKIIGPILDESYAAQLRQTIGDTGTDAEILRPIPNHYPEYARLIRGATAVLLPSKSEVFPLTFIESIVLGTPIACTSNCLLKDEYFSDATWCKFAVPEVTAFSKAVAAIMGQQVPPETIENVHSRFQWRRIAENLTSFYHETLA